MMNDLLPFEQPYHPISAEFGQAMLDFQKRGGLAAANAAGAAKLASRAPGPVATSKAGELFLVVPFSEKDEAKELGARWNPKAKKWYVPPGKDTELFKRWWAK